MKLFAKIILLWSSFIILANLYSEYIVSRPIDSIIQTVCTVGMILLTIYFIKVTVKLLTNK